MAAQLEWLLGQRGVTEPAIAEGVRAAITGQPIGAAFPRGSHENIILRLACVWAIRAPWLSPRFLVMTPLELQAVADGQTTLAKALALVAEVEQRAIPPSPLSTRVRALVQADALDIEALWSAEGASLTPLLRELHERLRSPEGLALLDAVSAELATVVAETSSPPPFEVALRSAMLGDRAAMQTVIDTGLTDDQLAAAISRVRATLSAEEQFLAKAVQAGGAFDAGVVQGALTASLLGQYLQHVFSALVRREPVPQLGPTHLVEPLQWLCDLFVDAFNADPAVAARCEAHALAIGRGEATTAQLTAELAGRLQASNARPLGSA